METVDAIARRYGVTPAELLAEHDEFRAFSINLWAHNWGVQREEWLRQHPPKRGGRRGR